MNQSIATRPWTWDLSKDTLEGLVISKRPNAVPSGDGHQPTSRGLYTYYKAYHVKGGMSLSPT